MMVAAALALMLPATSVGARGDACPSNSTIEPAATRRGCIAKIVNKVETPKDCEALCCAAASKYSSKLEPNQGCNAWFINDYQQCFMCSGARDPVVPPAVPASKQGGCNSATPSETNCTTGLVTPPPPPPLPPAPTKGPLGGEASAEYVDYARMMRWPSHLNGSKMDRSLLSAEGWPTADCSIVVFDKRPTGAWSPPIDDPEQRQADLSGTWMLALSGKATISLADPAIKGITLGEASYSAATNTQMQPLTIAKGKYLTKGTGFRDLKMLMPAHDSLPTRQLFSDNWAALMKPFDHLRWMGSTGTNSYSWQCGGDNAAGCSVITWEDRALPSYAFLDKALCKGCLGTPWEHVLLAANELGSDVWINVPVTASAPTVCRTAATTATPPGDPQKCLDDDPTQTYEHQLATLFKHGNNYTGNVGLKEGLRIYVEHSNEVWNFGFPQYALNKAMAEWEVNKSTDPKTGGAHSNLAHPVQGRPDIDCSTNSGDCWTHRRHARRVFEISQTFEKVFGAGALGNRVRMVYASWTINQQEYYNNTLAWLAAEYGAPSKFLYAIAAAQYFGPHAQDAKGDQAQFNYSTATVPEVVAAFYDGADANVKMTTDFVGFAKSYGLKTAGYESGPGYAVGRLKPGTKALNTLIAAARDPGMTGAIVYDVEQTCWRHGWDIYNYFAVEGPVSRYGCWGAAEDWKDINPGSPKLQAIYNITGHAPDALAKWATDPHRERAQESR